VLPRGHRDDRHSSRSRARAARTGRPEKDSIRLSAIRQLANGLDEGNQHEDRLEFLKAQLDTDIRLGASETDILDTKANLAICYSRLQQHDESLALRREVYAKGVALGRQGDDILIDALNLSASLRIVGLNAKAKSFLRVQLPKARRELGAEHDTVIRLRALYARLLGIDDDEASRDNLVEAVANLEELDALTQRVYGTGHPVTARNQRDLEKTRSKLASFDAPC